jgi:hypothetical protein
MPASLDFTIADISLVIDWPAMTAPPAVPEAYRPFEGRGAEPLLLAVDVGRGPAPVRAKVFESPPIWTLYRGHGELQFRMFETYPDLRRTLLLSEEGGRSRLLLQGTSCDPFVGPALELLMITQLAGGDGVVMHACGIDAGGMGIVFAGESGAGKSTLSRLWASHGQVEILSDDRVVVRRRNGRFVLYGTPWHGDACFAAPGGVPLAGIFFIRHGAGHSATSMRKAAAVMEMLKCSFPPYWDAGGMGAALALFEALASAVPCAELAFAPDLGVVDFMLASLQSDDGAPGEKRL